MLPITLHRIRLDSHYLRTRGSNSGSLITHLPSWPKQSIRQWTNSNSTAEYRAQMIVRLPEKRVQRTRDKDLSRCFSQGDLLVYGRLLQAGSRNDH